MPEENATLEDQEIKYETEKAIGQLSAWLVTLKRPLAPPETYGWERREPIECLEIARKSEAEKKAKLASIRRDYEDGLRKIREWRERELERIRSMPLGTERIKENLKMMKLYYADLKRITKTYQENRDSINRLYNRDEIKKYDECVRRLGAYVR